MKRARIRYLSGDKKSTFHFQANFIKDVWKLFLPEFLMDYLKMFAFLNDFFHVIIEKNNYYLIFLILSKPH